MNNPLHGQNVDLNAELINEELDDAQLEAISGGIIIVGGLQAQFASRFNSVMLNPQPLPPKELWRNYF
jgi:hypothetical protein